MAVLVRPTGPGDLTGLSALFAARFGHSLSADEWEWKYRRGPLSESRSWVAAESTAGGDGEIVAHAGALCFDAVWKGRSAPAWQLVDFVARGSAGLRPPLVRLGRALLDDLPRDGELPWIFGFPSPRHFRLGERAFGYRPLQEIQVREGWLAEVAEPKEGEAVVEQGDRAGTWASEAWAPCVEGGVRRTVEFFNWRYHARPGRYYRVYRLRGNRARDGCLVAAFVGRLAAIAELWLPAGNDWDEALREVAKDLRSAGLDRWRFWPGNGAAASSSLERLPIEPAGSVFLGGRGDVAAHDAGFSIAMGDWDAV